MRSTLADVARAAGVSNATVDRVLNKRAGVHDRTRDAVVAAAVRLGYIADEHGEVNFAASKIRLDFVLPADANSFMHTLRKELTAQSAARPDVETVVHMVEGFNPDTLAAKLGELESTSDGVGLVAIDHPAVRHAIKRLSRGGTKTITLVSDVHNVPRVGYVGIDNRSAGRLSGYLLGRLLGHGRHKVALFAGSVSYRGHEEREMGFRHILSEHENLEIVAFSEIRDDDERGYAAAVEHLTRHADLAAIYNIGAGTPGIARALQELRRADEVVFIGHDLTDQTKGYLLSGLMDVVIDQNPQVEARDALEQLARAVRGRPWNAYPLRTQIICKENVPEDLE